jgi:PEP-CTERM motif
MTKATKLLGILLAVFCLAAASPAFADTFAWTYAGSGDSGSGSLSATFMSGNSWQITGISGTFDGLNIGPLLPAGTCCLAPANDNILTFPGNPAFLDLAGLGLGIGFALGSTDVNIYNAANGAIYPGADFVLQCSALNCGPTTVLTSNSGTFTVTPEPATMGLLASGLVGLFLAAKKRA